MKSSQRIRQTLARYQRRPVTQQGILGNAVGEISVPNRIDYVYVRMAGLGTISVYNKRVPLILDLPVDVGYDPLEPKNFQVLNIHRYPQGGGRGLVDVATILHGKTHNWAGIDPVFIEKRQLMPLRPTPLGGMQVYVTREVTYYDDKAVSVTGQQLDLSPYVPATGSLMVLIYKDTDELIKVSTGGALKDLFTLSLADAPQVYPGTVPIALIRLYGGQSGIAEGYQDTDLIDVRQLFSPIDATGTSSGGGHTIQDEGVDVPARGHLNFVGAGVLVSDDAGNDATKIIITGSSGGGIVTGAHNIQDEGTTLPYRPALNFQGASIWAVDNPGQSRIDIIVSGTSNNLFIDQIGGTGTYGILEGDRNGVNTRYRVSQGIYTTGKLAVYLNGLVQTQGAGQDWVETLPASGTFDFVTAPISTDCITALYGYLGSGGGGSGGGSTPSTIPADIYIATTGNDTSGDGTAGAPYATMAKALSVLPNDIVTDCTIHVADGTYAEPIIIKKFTTPYSATLTILGNTSTPANVIFTGTTTSGTTGAQDETDQAAGVVIGGPVRVALKGIKVNVTAYYGILATRGAFIQVEDVISTGTLSVGISTLHHSEITLAGTITVSGFTYKGIEVELTSEGAILDDAAITITGPGSGSSFGMSVSGSSDFSAPQWAGGETATLTINEVTIGINCNLASNTVFGTGTTIVIDNVATPADSAAFYTTDTSAMSSWGPVTIDHFTWGFEAICLSYQESQGDRTLTNVGTPTRALQNSVVTLV